jgi:uncharacterized membrane protein YidH (DUF202 family)
MTSPGDPGLQAERTALAWRRTSLAVLANAVLVLKAGTQYEQRWVVALGAVLLAMAGVTAVWGHRRQQALSRPQEGPVSPSAGLLLSLAAGLLCVALAATAMLTLALVRAIA